MQSVPLSKDRKFKTTQCVSDWSMINRRPAVIADTSGDERIPQHPYFSTFFKSLVMTPVGDDRPIGALGALSDLHLQPIDYEVEVIERWRESEGPREYNSCGDAFEFAGACRIEASRIKSSRRERIFSDSISGAFTFDPFAGRDLRPSHRLACSHA